MTNSRNVTTEMVRWLDAVGAEPLAGSGFEDEQPEHGFADGELPAGEVGSAGRE
jgi:hypothetical protein